MAAIPQGQGTSKVEPVQTELDWVTGSPEGRDYGPPGYVEIDYLTGEWWRKTTPIDQNTGWELINSGGGGGGNIIDFGDPPPGFKGKDGQQWRNRTNGNLWWYDAFTAAWYQDFSA